MTVIVLHGHLKDLYPNEIQVEANSASEALQSLALIPALQPEPGKNHLVRVEGFGTIDALYDKREIDVLHVHPVMAGAGGKAGVAQILIGVVLIVVGYFTQSPKLVYMGAMAILGGVLAMMAPAPKGTDTQERSRYLGNGRNTVAIGTRIPMIYGRRKAYGHYISFDIDASTFDSAPASWYSSPFTDYGDTTHSAAPPDQPMYDPATAYNQPTSIFTGLTYPPSMEDPPETYVNFNAALLQEGDWDMSFATGQIVRVRVLASGMVTRATMRSPDFAEPPVVGTPISFSQNYV